MAKINRILKTVEDTEAAFYDAIGRADIESLMALWADDEEIVCIHPGSERLVGHAAIRLSWEAIFERGGVQIRQVQLHAIQNLMMSIHNVIEEIHQAGGLPKDMHVIASNVYLKTPRGWRIVAHHASVAPGKTPVDPALSGLLH